MRALPVSVLFLLTAILALANVAAQDETGEPGCPQGNPCEIELGLNADGIYDLSYDTFGTGDWVLFSVYNEDDQAHTVRLEGHDFELTIEAEDIEDSQPLKLGSPGTYELRDEPSGDTKTLTVEAFEVFDADSSSTKSGNPIPGLAPSLLVLGLAATAFVARRR